MSCVIYCIQKKLVVAPSPFMLSGAFRLCCLFFGCPGSLHAQIIACLLPQVIETQLQESVCFLTHAKDGAEAACFDEARAAFLPSLVQKILLWS